MEELIGKISSLGISIDTGCIETVARYWFYSQCMRWGLLAVFLLALTITLGCAVYCGAKHWKD